MKFLGIQKLLWFIIVVAFTLFEGILLLVCAIIYFIWNLKIPHNYWSDYHKAETDQNNLWGGYAYQDDNIWQTIIRRYKHTF